MIHHRTKKQVRFFDIFKLITTIILLLIILYTWRSCSNLMPEEASTGPATTQVVAEAEQAQPASQPATQAEEAATSTPLPTPTLEPTPTEVSTPVVSEAPAIAPPTLTMPAGAVRAGEVTLSGTGDPGSEVEIVVDGQVVGTATVGSDGNWETTVELPDAGEYTLQIQTVDSGGAILAESEAADLVVETPAEEAVAEAEIIPPTLTMPAGAVSPGEVILSGTGDPGSEVEIVADGQVVGTATVGSDGNWETTVELPDAGEYTLQVRAMDSRGRVLAESLSESLSVSEPAAPATTPTSATDQAQTTTGVGGASDQVYIVQVDDWLSKLADKFYGDMFAYPAIVTATNNKAAEDDSFTVITDPDLIEVGQKLWIPASP